MDKGPVAQRLSDAGLTSIQFVLAAGLAMNATALAISCGVPMRPVGLSARERWNSSGLPCSICSQTPPGK